MPTKTHPDEDRVIPMTPAIPFPTLPIDGSRTCHPRAAAMMAARMMAVEMMAAVMMVETRPSRKP